MRMSTSLARFPCRMDEPKRNTRTQLGVPPHDSIADFRDVIADAIFVSIESGGHSTQIEDAASMTPRLLSGLVSVLPGLVVGCVGVIDAEDAAALVWQI